MTGNQQLVPQTAWEAGISSFFGNSASILDYHLKTGHTLSVQNRPTGLAEDVIVLPCRSVRLQGLGLSPRSGV
jgi:hypothetical protein